MTDAPILEMRNISKAFGGVHALRDVSFSCRKGKVHALLGENGAGKSTLIKILAGAYRADSGEIVFKGQRHASFSAREAMATGISIIYQELNLVQFMTVAENIFLGREPRNRLGVIDTRRIAKESVGLLDRLGVRLSPSAQIGDLTVANQQMVEIAKALSQKADLVVMDEPSAILAGHELHSLFATIRSLVEQGVTVIYIAHRLNEIFEIADDVTVLKDGRVVGAQPISEVTRARLIQMMVGRPLEEIFPRAVRMPLVPGQPDALRGRNSWPSWNGRRGSDRSGPGAVRCGRASHWQDPAQGHADSAAQPERGCRGRDGACARRPQNRGTVPRTVDT
jgi:ABC-type sugar transport system ATPase subunit